MIAKHSDKVGKDIMESGQLDSSPTAQDDKRRWNFCDPGGVSENGVKFCLPSF